MASSGPDSLPGAPMPPSANVPLIEPRVPRGARAGGRAQGWWAVALMAIAGGAVAQVAASQDYLARMDADGNGRVSLDEYQAWMGYAFAQMDRNRDDRLTPDELPGGRGREVSLTEHRQRLAEAFRRQDTSGDGVLDARELAAPPQK